MMNSPIPIDHRWLIHRESNHLLPFNWTDTRSVCGEEWPNLATEKKRWLKFSPKNLSPIEISLFPVGSLWVGPGYNCPISGWLVLSMAIWTHSIWHSGLELCCRVTNLRHIHRSFHYSVTSSDSRFTWLLNFHILIVHYAYGILLLV